MLPCTSSVQQRATLRLGKSWKYNMPRCRYGALQEQARGRIHHRSLKYNTESQIVSHISSCWNTNTMTPVLSQVVNWHCCNQANTKPVVAISAKKIKHSEVSYDKLTGKRQPKTKRIRRDQHSSSFDPFPCILLFICCLTPSPAHNFRMKTMTRKNSYAALFKTQ